MTVRSEPVDVAAVATTEAPRPWHAKDGYEVAEQLGVDVDKGLAAGEAATRLARYGANVLQHEATASVWSIALGQLRDPMNIMLLVFAVVSLGIAQFSAAVVVSLLVLLNVVLGTNQELKARASVEALAQLQVPLARVVRDGALQSIPATDVLPGDVLAVEAGDIVAYKYMATFHRWSDDQGERIIEIVKGAPDVLLDHSAHALRVVEADKAIQRLRAR
jgi:Ca2+-transporting ATPase